MASQPQPHIDSTVSILIPLYQYPINPLTWRPLFEAISNSPSTKFIIIINPNSGPGVDPDGWTPDKRYSRGISKLKDFSNVTLVGYVRLDYCRRNLESIQTDIEKYAAWSQISDLPGSHNQSDSYGLLAMSGIFFDEVPNLFTEQVADQLASLTKMVRDVDGFGHHASWVIHNPGTIPDIEFLAFWTKMSSRSQRLVDKEGHNTHATSSDCSDSDQDEFVQALENVPSPKGSRIGGEPDLVVIFEGPYSDWQNDLIQERMARLSRYDRSQCCYIVHSVPQGNLKQLFEEIKVRGGHLYVTDLEEKFYESFGKSWMRFTELTESANMVARNRS